MSKEVIQTEQQTRLEKRAQLAIEKLATDPEKQQLFKMSEEEICGYLSRVEISDVGLKMSPSFQSPGWAVNADERADVNVSDLGQNEAVLLHELKHALHYFFCVRLFEQEETAQEAITLFSKYVIRDAEFIEWVKEYINEFGVQNLKNAVQLTNRTFDLSEVQDAAVILGAITYQHAYFVDAAVCEAIASFEDEGAFLVFNSFLNRVFGLMLPGRQALEGYLNQDIQEKVAAADPLKVALMIKKSEYVEQVDEYWE